MIAKMCKVEVVGSKARLPQVLEKIQAIGVLHVEEVPLISPRPGRFELHRIPLSPEQEEEKKKLEDAAENLDETARMIPSAAKDKIEAAAPVSGGSLDRLVEESKKWLAEASALHKKEADLLDELRILENYDSILGSIGALVDKSGKQMNFRCLGISVAKEERAVFRVLEEELGKITNNMVQIYKGEEGKKDIAALIGFPPEFEQQVKDFIWNKGISEIKLPSAFQDQPLTEAVQGLKKRIAEIPAEGKMASQEIAAYFGKKGKEILSRRRWCHTQLGRLEVVDQLAESHYAFVIVGWLPEKRLEEFRAELKKSFADEVVVNRLVPGRRDYGKVPVCLDNPKWMKPFELLLKIFPPPVYGSIDATLFIGIVFPIFFGYILGDVFYGLILGGMALYFRKKWKSNPLLKQALLILYACTASSIFFGFLFGEFAGDLGHKWFGMRPILFNREVDILTTLYVAVGIGVVHVFLGLALSVYIAVKSGDRHGIWAHSVFFATVAATMIALFSMMGVLPAGLAKIAGWSLAGFLPLLIYLHGAMAPMEIISTLGNMLSYARLMAIGLASVILALVANKFVTLFGNIALGLLLAVILHALNFALGVFAPTVQSLRLHYVEFFMKFYKPEGRSYQPFAISK